MNGYGFKMERIYELFDDIFDVIYNNLFEPLFHGIDLFLTLLVSPISSYTPRTQIIIVSVFGALISRILARTFRAKREKVLHEQFKEKLSTLKHTKDVEDKNLEKVIRKGISRSADAIYEKIMLDKFFEMGISYFLPLFFFLIWLQYSLFTPERLEDLTGSPYAWVTDSGLRLSAAYVYLFSFNIILSVFWLLEGAIRFTLKRRKKLKS